MPEILALLQIIAPLLAPTTFCQMSHIIFGMLVINGRITMLGLSRWTEKGGSYRTIQRYYHIGRLWRNRKNQLSARKIIHTGRACGH